MGCGGSKLADVKSSTNIRRAVKDEDAKEDEKLVSDKTKLSYSELHAFKRLEMSTEVAVSQGYIEFAENVWHRDLLAKINSYREAHGVPLLNLSTSLCRLAQHRANKLGCELRQEEAAPTVEKEHKGQLCGESYCIIKDTVDGGSIVKKWYAESENYNYATNVCTPGKGNFTQMVWRSTKELGCAMNLFRLKDHWYTACVVFYFPCGNQDKEFQISVNPPNSGEFPHFDKIADDVNATNCSASRPQSKTRSIRNSQSSLQSNMRLVDVDETLTTKLESESQEQNLNENQNQPNVIAEQNYENLDMAAEQNLANQDEQGVAAEQNSENQDQQDVAPEQNSENQDQQDMAAEQKSENEDQQDVAPEPNRENQDQQDGTAEPNSENQDQQDGTAEPNSENQDQQDGTAEPNSENQDQQDETGEPNSENQDQQDGTAEPNSENQDQQDVTAEPNSENQDQQDGTAETNSEKEDQKVVATEQNLQDDQDVADEKNPDNTYVAAEQNSENQDQQDMASEHNSTNQDTKNPSTEQNSENNISNNKNLNSDAEKPIMSENNNEITNSLQQMDP